MKASVRIFLLLVWLSALGLAATIILGYASSRVGQHRSSTYGKAYRQFESSWGGEIAVPPPDFMLERTYVTEEYDTVAKQYREVRKTERISLTPESIRIHSDIEYGEQRRGWLTFNAFEAGSEDAYGLRNTTEFSGALLLKVNQPAKANLMRDFTVRLGQGGDGPTWRPTREPLLLLSTFEPGQTVDVTLLYRTNGMDLFKHDLSSYHRNVVKSLEAEIALNTDSFQVYRFGLPHTVEHTDSGTLVRFAMEDFSTTQDLGVTFVSKRLHLDRVHGLMVYAHCSPLLFLLVLFVCSQVSGLRFNAFHYLFIVLINVFYFLFLAYLVRFFNVGVCLGLATVLTTIMFTVYCPNVLGRRFAYRIAGSYLFLLTVVFSLIFMMPVFRGVLFLTLVFVILLSVMVRLGRTDLSRWPVVTG